MLFNLRNISCRAFLIVAVFISICAVSCWRDRNAGNKDTEEEAAAFIENQAALYNSGKIHDYRGLIRNLDSFNAARKNISPRARATVYTTLSRHYFELRHYDTASIYADSVLYVMEQNGMQENYFFDYVDALTEKGKTLYAANHFTQAYNYFFRAKQLTAHINDTCGFHGFTYGLAMIAYKQKKYRKAADYFKQSYRSALRCERFYIYQLQEDLDNIALCFEKMNMPDSALYYYDSVLSLISKNAASFGSEVTKDKALGVVYGNIGSVFLSTGKTDTAITLLTRGYEINIQSHYENRDALLTHLKLARAYLRKGDMPLMFTALTDIRAELDTIDHTPEAESSWQQLMYRYYEQAGRQAEAFQHYRNYSDVRDSLWQMEKEQLQNDITRDLLDKEKSLEISLLQKENKINTLYLTVTISLSVLALIIVVLVYTNYRRSRKNVEELKHLNQQISEQKKQLERTTDDLRQSNLDKDRILHIVAHDLRSPVSAVMTLLNMISEGEEDPEHKEYIAMSLDASQSALSLISELLEFSGGAATGSPAIKEDTEINDLVQKSVNLAQFKAAEKKQSLHLSLNEAPLHVHVNREKIKRVLANLIANAIKFSQEHSAIYVSVAKKNNTVIIEVKDHGIGIPEKILPRIFDAFTSAKRHGTAGEKSFGLGLSICRQIVEDNNGKIYATSTEGAGSSFFIELPLI